MDSYLIELKKLLIYKSIKNDKIVKKFEKLIDSFENNSNYSELVEKYYSFYSSLISFYPDSKQIMGNLWQNHLLNLILENENVFSLACENNNYYSLPDYIINSVLNDLSIIDLMLNFKFELTEKKLNIDNAFFTALNNNDKNNIKNSLLSDLPNKISDLASYYSTHGCGLLSKYHAFRWIDDITCVPSPDPITLDDLIGYNSQKDTLIKNTQRLLDSKPANNILLYGDRGTGKSSSVKALLNKYADKGLRLIEVSKYNLNSLPHIIEYTKGRGLKFIIFVDDLSFEKEETTYKELKSVLEGGIEAKPDNVVIYATSNRRHLLKEYFSERNDEVTKNDTMQEKLSLSDRFGIIVTFLTPDQDEFLNIVYKLADKYNINMRKEDLRRQALIWEKWNNGVSPRTAKQFILSLDNYSNSTLTR